MANPTAQNRNIYTVSKLNRLVKTILEGEVGSVWISAEISNFTAASSGHWYFTLKDARAQIRTAMFRGANARLSMRPKEGDKVLVRGNLSLYEPRGDYQLICEHMEMDGSGALQAAFEQLKAKLNAQGLFSTELKRPLPADIQRVGIVTSATGAALHDVLTVLKRRSPSTDVIVYPAQVQGASAHLSLIAAIKTANARNEVDVLIVGRGGGSIEDLWSFNNEQLALTIRASDIPIVSAVGHEVDITIADYVADMRAPTPSAAAELVSKDIQQITLRLDTLRRALTQHFRRICQQHQYQLSGLTQRLQRNHPSRRLNTQYQRLDELSARLQAAVRRRLSQSQERLERSASRFKTDSLSQRLTANEQTIARLQQRLQQSITRQLSSQRKELENAAQMLHSVSPLATLARGYSVTLKEDKVVTTTQQVRVGDRITTKLVNGEFSSIIEQLKP